jgi:site-specific recombinase XerD
MAILASAANVKHAAMLMLAYSSGLRIGELVMTNPEHIIADSMRVRIGQGKGNKGRYTILSRTCLTCLRRYFKKYRPSKWLIVRKGTGEVCSVFTVNIRIIALRALWYECSVRLSAGSWRTTSDYFLIDSRVIQFLQNTSK